jgi:hypothetical protein
MPDYRACLIGPDGHIQSRVELICIDDGAPGTRHAVNGRLRRGALAA